VVRASVRGRDACVACVHGRVQEAEARAKKALEEAESAKKAVEENKAAQPAKEKLPVAELEAAVRGLRVKFEVETPDGRESFTVRVHADWAPIGANRFKDLVELHYFDDTRFFRVVKDFVVQFGMHGVPSINKPWANNTMSDEPAKHGNKAGTLVFAKAQRPNSRTTQLFFNLGDNSEALDKEGFAPFAEVEGDGLEVLRRVYTEHGEEPKQQGIFENGNKYLDENFPKLSHIISARIVASAPPPPQSEEAAPEDVVEF